MKFVQSLLLSILFAAAGNVAAFPKEDLIEELPSYGKTPTPHYSGYLDASKGCDIFTNGPICKIHYWFAMAEGGDDVALKKPVVLWLNGGPGSSSILGFLQEEGPLLVNATGGLMVNPWSWTRLVNLLVIEAPMGVGYSNTDRYTASASRAALVDFFKNKFPEFGQSDFFITGESYAGVYIPTLSKEILDHTDIALKGIAVGDPCTDNKAQDDSMNSLWYANKYGLMDEEVYDLLWNKCNVRLPNLMTQGGVSHVISTLNKELLMIEDLEARRDAAHRLYHKVVLNGAFDQKANGDTAECTIALRKFMMSTSHGLSQSWRDLYIDDYSLFAPVSTLEDEQMARYMSRADVRKALHVAVAPTTTWPYASIGFDYTKEYKACNWGTPVLDISMIDIYREIVPKLERTWIYNGDTDPCVSYEGTRLAVKQIQLDELDGGSYRPWFYNQTAAPLEVLATKSALFGPNLVAQNMGPQFGGEVVDYKEGLAFVTFHGSGHMVPQFRPQAALHFLNQFLNRSKLLTPLLPSNSTLAAFGDPDFRTAMDGWTEAARKAPYVTEDLVTEGATTPIGTTSHGEGALHGTEQNVELALHYW
eukprot:scaffold504_cov109-Cylindrotheca_fusiformis.AAC.6